MDYKVEKQEGAVKITFTVPGDVWQEEVTKTYLETRGKYSIPGFRKGHAPRGRIEQLYGKGVFFDDTIERLCENGYREALGKENWIIPVDSPKIDVEEFSDEKVVITALVTVRPEVKLGAYKNLEIEKAEVAVTDDEINAEIEHMRGHAARMVEVSDRPVADGDIVTLDYSGSIDGVKFDGGTAQNQELVIGSNTFIPGFEEQMIGMNVGENKDLHVKFPDEYGAKELAGKDAVFNVTVHKITVKELPELNDDFARDVSECDTFAALKDDVKKKIETNKQNVADRDATNALIEKIVENSEIQTIPQCMINRGVDEYIANLENQLKYYYGASMSDYLRDTGMKITDLRKQYTEQATAKVRRQLVLSSVVEAEKLEVTDKEIEDAYEREAEAAKASGRELTPQMIYELHEDIANALLSDKLIAFLKENNKFIAKKAEGAPKSKKPSTEKTAPKKSTKKAEPKSE